VNIATLKKGDVITVPTLQSILDCEYSTKVNDRMAVSSAYALKLLGYKESLERDLAKRGLHYTLRTDHGSIVICTDEEAAAFNPRQQESSLNRFARAQERNRHVDASNLNTETQSAHTQNIVNGSRILQAITRAKDSIALESEGQKTPQITG